MLRARRKFVPVELDLEIGVPQNRVAHVARYICIVL